MNNFDLKKFLVENKLTTNSKMLSEAAKKPTIKILKDLYYFDKLGSLGAKADIDEKYHSGAKLVFKKGKSVADDTTHDDSEYKMITSSKRLKKGVDYEVNENNLTRASKALSENIEPKKLNKLSLGAKTYQVGDNDPNDEGKITTIEKFKNGYFITGRGPGPKEAYGYALDLKGNEKPGTSKEDLMENKLTRVSKTLIKEAMSMNDLDSMKIVTDEYLAEKGIQVNPSEDGSGQELLDMLNPPLISTIEADEDEGGADSYNVYDLGEGHLLVIDDYEGQFGIYRKAGGMNENLNLSRVDTFEFQIGDNLVTYGGGEKVKVLGVKPNLAAALADTENPKAVESLKQDLRKDLIDNEDKNKPFYLVTSESFPVDKYYIESELEVVENKLTAGSRLNENNSFTPKDKINFKWKNHPANPKDMLTDTESGEKFTKEEYWGSDIIGTDPSLIFPNYGNENSDGTWTLTFDEGEFSGFIEGEDFTL